MITVGNNATKVSEVGSTSAITITSAPKGTNDVKSMKEAAQAAVSVKPIATASSAKRSFKYNHLVALILIVVLAGSGWWLWKRG